jgi:hypothetical protein
MSIMDEYKWNRWFAWYPVKVNNKWKWCSHVYRKVDMDWEAISPSTVYKYGTAFDVLKDTHSS